MVTGAELFHGVGALKEESVTVAELYIEQME